MTEQLFETGLAQWGGPAALLVGLLSASLIYMRGRAVLERAHNLKKPEETPKEQGPEEPIPEFDPFVLGSRDEKRIALRRRGCHVPALISDSAGTAPPREGWVVDRSP